MHDDDTTAEALPPRIDHPLTDPDEERLRVPYATCADGQLAVWNISTSSAAPHMLVMGALGKGKTTTIRTIIAELVRRDVPVIGVDLGTNLDGIAGHPGVAAVITDPVRAAVLIRAVCAEMHARMEHVIATKISPSELPLLAVAVDEFLLLSTAWQRLITSGDDDTKDLLKSLDPLSALADLAALSRSSGIRLLIGVQRPADDELFGAHGGSVRDNFNTRVSVGPISGDAAMMLWGDPEAVRDVDASIPGRATVTGADRTPTPAQVWWTPNLDRHPTALDRMTRTDQELVLALTPDHAPAVTCFSTELRAVLDEEGATHG